MKSIFTALCLLALAGCAVPEREAGYAPLDGALLLLVKPLQPGHCPDYATACVGACDWSKRICTLYLPADTWLDCIAHEARHASEGAWHGETLTPCEVY